MEPIGNEERQILHEQLGRAPRGVLGVAKRCFCGRPQVIVTHPTLFGEGVFPTTFYLTCPRLVRAVSQLEAAGGVGRAQRELDRDPGLQAQLEQAHREYAQFRASLLSSEEWESLRSESPELAERLAQVGVGGISEKGVKCLHTHLAHYLAGGENPIGRWAWQELPWPRGCCHGGDRVAAIDLGSNSLRLLITDAEGTPLCRTMATTQLGRLQSGSLSSESMEASFHALREFMGEMGKWGVCSLQVGATSAVREAKNGQDFALEVSRLLTWPVQILSGEEEAALTYEGAASAFPGEDILVIDVGGGSTEVAWSGGGFSLPIGAVRLQRIPQEEWVEVLGDLPPLSGHWSRVVLTGGTATNLAAIDLGAYSPEMVQGHKMSRECLQEIHNRLWKTDVETRRAIPGIQPERAEVLPAGAWIYGKVLEWLEVDEVTIGEADLLTALAARARESFPV